MTKTVDPEMAAKLKDRLENELLPKLQNQKIRTRTAVAVNVLALVDRQIGNAEGPLEAEWEKLRKMVEEHPKALALINELEKAIKTYDEEIRTKAAETEGDEPAMRRTANALMRQAIMAKLKHLQEADREEEAKEMEAAKARFAEGVAAVITAHRSGEGAASKPEGEAADEAAPEPPADKEPSES